MAVNPEFKIKAGEEPRRLEYWVSLRDYPKVLTSGNFKTHIFTGDGCFVVSNAGNSGGSETVDYLVIAGGAGGAGRAGGGGGATWNSNTYTNGGAGGGGNGGSSASAGTANTGGGGGGNGPGRQAQGFCPHHGQGPPCPIPPPGLQTHGHCPQ